MQVRMTDLSFDNLSAIYNVPGSQFSSGTQDFFDKRLVEKGGGAEEGKQKPRVLVVDDAPDVTEMLATLLQHAGFDAVMAFSAVQALEVAQTERFDLVISDIGMPGMNGYDLAIALRALPEFKSVPMIAVTGFSMYDDKDRALESGFDAHLVKPVNPLSLLDLIKSLGG